jgi:adenylate cyclase class IV
MSTRIKSRTKYICNDKEELKDFMKKEGFIFKSSTLENDEYYLDTNFNLLQNNACIRIRTINNKEVVLSFEGNVENLSSIDIKNNQKVYLDISQKENISNFLESVGYYKYVSINILKETYVKKDREYYYSISIDTLENIGEFIDFDIYTESENEKEIDKIFYGFESKIEKCVGDKINIKYRDYSSKYIYNTLLKGNFLNRILVELDKIFVNINIDNLEESIKDNVTILNLELIESLEQKGITVEIVYSNANELMVNTLRKILDRIGYNPTFINIKDIK